MAKTAKLNAVEDVLKKLKLAFETLSKAVADDDNDNIEKYISISSTYLRDLTAQLDELDDYMEKWSRGPGVKKFLSAVKNIAKNKDTLAAARSKVKVRVKKIREDLIPDFRRQLEMAHDYRVAYWT